MAIKNITIKLEVDEINDSMYIIADSFAYPVLFSRFKELIQDNSKYGIDLEHLIRNVVIRASLSNVDVNNINSIKAAVEGVPFKV